MSNTGFHQYKMLGIAVVALICISMVPDATHAQNQTPRTAHIFAESNVCPTSFNRSLGLWDSGSDVRTLQQFLNTHPETRLADSGPGSPGQETQFYGTRTKSAVRRFQELYPAQTLIPNNQSSGNGEFGLDTRTLANRICNNRSPLPESTLDGGVGDNGDRTQAAAQSESQDLSQLQLRLNQLQLQLAGLQQQQLKEFENRIADLEEERVTDNDDSEDETDNNRRRSGIEGEIENFTITGTGNQHIRANQERNIIGFSFRARLSDISLKRIDILVEGINQQNERRPWRLIETIIIKRGGRRIETDVADEEFQWNEVGDDAYRFRVSVDEDIEEDHRARFSVAFNTREEVDSSDFPQDFRVGLASDTDDRNGVRFRDERGVQHFRGSTENLTRLRFIDDNSQRFSSGGSGGSASNRGGIYRHIQLF